MSNQMCTCRRLYPSGKAAKNLDPKCPVHGTRPATPARQAPFDQNITSVEQRTPEAPIRGVLPSHECKGTCGFTTVNANGYCDGCNLARVTAEAPTQCEHGMCDRAATLRFDGQELCLPCYEMLVGPRSASASTWTDPKTLWISCDRQGNARGIFYEEEFCREDAATYAPKDDPWTVHGPYDLRSASVPSHADEVREADDQRVLDARLRQNEKEQVPLPAELVEDMWDQRMPFSARSMVERAYKWGLSRGGRETGSARRVLDVPNDFVCCECGTLITNHVVVSRCEKIGCEESFVGPPYEAAPCASPASETSPGPNVLEPGLDVATSTPGGGSEEPGTSSTPSSGPADEDRVLRALVATGADLAPYGTDRRVVTAMIPLLAEVRRETVDGITKMLRQRAIWLEDEIRKGGTCDRERDQAKWLADKIDREFGSGLTKRPDAEGKSR